MDRNELTLAVAAALMLAVLLGWLLGLVAGRLAARGPRAAADAPDLAGRLRAAEASRSLAEARLAEVEADLRARLAEAEAERDAALRALDRAQANVEEVRAAYRAGAHGQNA